MDGFASSNLNETLEKIDTVISEKRLAIEKGKKLEDLMNTPNFIDVILDGFINDEAKRLFDIMVDPTGASPYTNEEIQLKLAGISTFKKYLADIKLEAERAPVDILIEDDYRKQVTAEAALNGDNL